MIKKLLRTILLVDILAALFVGVKCCFRKPVTKNLTDIKRSNKFRRNFTFDDSKCVGCKKCLEVCPCRAIQIIVSPRQHTHRPEKCCYCGLCQAACKFGAIKFKP
ncbi:MAG: 4Fe-4S binding protein [Holosporales bacterium]|nr:4Fe-4S binding protein [Holosporales bacterium]